MTISRRQFCGALGTSLAVANSNLFADDSKPKPFRVIAYNIYKSKGWPSDRPLARRAVAKGQMAERLAMELALHDPDIVNFSESPNEEFTKDVAELMGMNHVRFPSGGSWPGTLLSKSKVIESQNAPTKGERPKDLFTRHWGRATVELAGYEPLIVHSAHLFPTPDPKIRLREIRAMIESMKSDLDAGKSMLLIGDMNHRPDTEEYAIWMDAGWVDTFAKVGKGEGLTFKADIPNSRIDYVMAAGPIAERIIESRPLYEGAFRLNINDEESYSLSDHLPQLAVFQ
ncbi:Endonuclease/Exonuclease/phosphatase family protein [Roseimaritima multifibrata]|uniref:Endonuclease/Exonuclease/phosphatase family protein n=1 Tax=Roseimaritima multifibrata TaxID=1930274 RepID=A0A517MH74_9BACT|nr:endonuclease/exonuclease/phosphatase family protein [Roseimaritima multifibrata]QDS94234.1 Endonuclease/Exonuclease/phosphatase family protein [Roseimaritima multifibrata]